MRKSIVKFQPQPWAAAAAATAAAAAAAADFAVAAGKKFGLVEGLEDDTDKMKKRCDDGSKQYGNAPKTINFA